MNSQTNMETIKNLRANEKADLLIWEAKPLLDNSFNKEILKEMPAKDITRREEKIKNILKHIRTSEGFLFEKNIPFIFTYNETQDTINIIIKNTSFYGDIPFTDLLEARSREYLDDKKLTETVSLATAQQQELRTPNTLINTANTHESKIRIMEQLKLFFDKNQQNAFKDPIIINYRNAYFLELEEKQKNGGCSSCQKKALIRKYTNLVQNHILENS